MIYKYSKEMVNIANKTTILQTLIAIVTHEKDINIFLIQKLVES